MRRGGQLLVGLHIYSMEVKPRISRKYGQNALGSIKFIGEISYFLQTILMGL
jgi:hypothetical protein